MTTNQKHQRLERAGQVIDGERHESHLEPGDQELLSRLRAIERDLRASYSPEAIAAASAPTDAPDPARRLAWLKIAALIALAATAIFLFSRNPGTTQRPVDATYVHAAFVQGAEPAVVCDTPAKFLAYTRESLGAPIAANLESPVELLGWRGVSNFYSESQGPGARVLLARAADGSPIVVIFQPRRDPRPTLPDQSDLLMHSKRLGPVTAWEVSALDQPRVLPLLRLERD